MRIVSLNLSPIREVSHKGRVVRTGIYKQPTQVPVMLRERGFDGDQQADKKHHGWITQAAYAFAAEEYAHWRATLARADLPFGLFGENLTVEGLDDEKVCIGDVYRVGDARVQVTFPREPCSTLAMAVNDTGFPKVFLARKRVGPYFRVLAEGLVQTGDEVARESAHPARLSIAQAIDLMHFAEGDAAQLRGRYQRAAQIEALDERWKTKFVRMAAAQE